MENQDSELRTLDFYKCLVFCHIKHYFPTHTEPTQLFCCEHTYCTFRPGLWSSWLSDLKCGSIRAITLSLTLFYFTCITGIPLLHVFKFPCIFKASLNVSPPPLHHSLFVLLSFFSSHFLSHSRPFTSAEAMEETIPNSNPFFTLPVHAVHSSTASSDAGSLSSRTLSYEVLGGRVLLHFLSF